MLQEIVNVANLGLIALGPNLEIRLWNRWMVDATGIEAEAASYQRAEKLLPSVFTPAILQKVREALRNGTATNIPQSEGDFALSSQAVEISLQPLESRHYVHSLRPIREELSERLCLVQLRPLQGFGTSANIVNEEGVRDTKGHGLDFLAMVGHQIRTPVNGVVGVAELLRDTELSKEQQKYLDLLLRASSSLRSFVDDLTDLAYLEAGGVVLEEEASDLTLLVQDVMGLFETTGSQKGVRGVLEVTSSVPKFVTTDHQKLKQLLVALVGNAFKFTHRGHVLLKVDYQNENERPELFFEITDTGVGIPKNRLGAVLGNGKPGGKQGRYFNSTGLGMYICREIIDLFGGQIEVHSALDQGTTFKLRVPVGPAASVGRAKTGKKLVGKKRDYGQLRILLAEDNPVNQALFRKILEKQGHEIVIVNNGQEAVRAVQIEAPFDIILMDIAMPVMDGLEATALIRSLFGPAGKTPILALTAHALMGDREIFLNAGMDGYQSKPTDPDSLQEAMARAIASRKGRKNWSDFMGRAQLAHPGSGPMSWLRFPKSGRRRGTGRADQ